MASKQFTVYSYVGSQWAGVVHLALAEKGFTSADYDVKEIDLVTAENFDLEYLEVNPNGTVPSLTSPTLDKPLTESTDILRYLDSLKGVHSLVPKDDQTKLKVEALLDLVHSHDVDTNIILLQPRDEKELEEKIETWKPFVVNRQKKLDLEHAAHPEHPFYGPKAEENRELANLYTTKIGPGVLKLDTLIKLPFAAGSTVAEADLHIAPWLSHAMVGAGTNPSDKKNFEPLEKLIQKTVPEFEVGPKIKEWWSNMNATESFTKVFPVLH